MKNFKINKKTILTVASVVLSLATIIIDNAIQSIDIKEYVREELTEKNEDEDDIK